VSGSFVYDGVGRREKKTISGSLTEFLYDGVNPVQETSGANVLANILPGLGIDEFHTRTDIVAGTSNYLLSDVLGSTIALTDSAGIAQTEYSYEPFGKTSINGASNTNSFRYTGREDDGIGLYYYRSRYFDPKLQRFISEDPISSAAFNSCSANEALLRNMFTSGGGLLTQASNAYGYVGNQPTMLSDPSGLGPCETTFFQECLPDVNKQQIQCQSNTARVASICLGTCAAGCIAFGPGPQYAACVTSCISTVCSIVVIGGNASCLAQSVYGRWQCFQDYQSCKRNSKSQG
jgi:RHS repeat-associated protein